MVVYSTDVPLRTSLIMLAPIRFVVSACSSVGGLAAFAFSLCTPTLSGQARLPSFIPPRLVADAVMTRYVFLPVTLQGKAVTVLLDLGANGHLILAQNAVDHLDLSVTPGILDSLRIGTDVVQNVPVEVWDGEVPFDGPPPPGLPPVVGFVGTKLLWRYDLLFDGPAHRVRLYQRSPQPAPLSRAGRTRAAGWLPAGMTQKDCLPLTVEAKHDSAEHGVSFPLQVNGHAIPSFLDSGADETTINLPAAQLLGFQASDSHVHVLPADSSQSYPGVGPMTVWGWTGVRVTVAGKTLVVRDFRVAEHIPSVDESLPELDLGLDAIRDRLVWIAYSTNHICVGNRISNRQSP